MNLANFFISRPIYATVLSLLIVIVGGISFFSLPVEQYPQLAPPTIQVTAVYPGATAETVAATVATTIDIAKPVYTIGSAGFPCRNSKLIRESTKAATLPPMCNQPALRSRTLFILKKSKKPVIPAKIPAPKPAPISQTEALAQNGSLVSQ